MPDSCKQSLESLCLYHGCWCAKDHKASKLKPSMRQHVDSSETLPLASFRDWLKRVPENLDVNAAMRQYFTLPLVFGFGLLVGGFMPFHLRSMSIQENETLPGKLDPVSETRQLPKSGIPEKSPATELSRSPVPTPPVSQLRPTQLRIDGDFLKREKRRPFMSLPKEADCDPRAHILVINHEGEAGQKGRDHINQEFRKAGLSGYFHFWPAESSATQSRAGEINGRLEHHEFTQALSHRKIYETMLYMKWACATIFEDNVRLVDDFLTRLTSITVTDSIPPFDLIFWGSCNTTVEKEVPHTKKPELTYGQPDPCLIAYTVSLQGALFLLQAAPHSGEANGTAWKVRPHIDKSWKSMPGSYWHVVPSMAFQG